MQKALLRPWRPSFTAVRHYLYPRNFISFLKCEHQPQHTQLENGLTISTLKTDCCNVSVGFYADAGARYEHPNENGIAHFFEHLVFKGTRSSPREELQKKINALGIKLHANTNRELVAYTADCLVTDLKPTFAILVDCIYNNSLDLETIRAEKCIVYEEIMEQECDPKAVIFDYLHATAFQGTGLANSIIGTTRNLYAFDPTTLRQHLSKILNPCRVCLCIVGDVEHQEMVDMVQECLNRTLPAQCLDLVYRYTGSEVRYRNDAMPKAHVAFALEGPAFNNIDSIYIDLACSIIGGWDKSQLGGEDHAVAVARRASGGEFCDAYKAFNIKYRDTSLWGAQFVARSTQHEDMLFTIQDIILGMTTMITDGELERGKEQLKSKILYNTDSCHGAALDIATHVLYNCCHWPTLYDRLDFIDRIEMDDFKARMYGYVFNKLPVVAAIGPTEGLPDYNRISSSMYWANGRGSKFFNVLLPWYRRCLSFAATVRAGLPPSAAFSHIDMPSTDYTFLWRGRSCSRGKLTLNIVKDVGRHIGKSQVSYVLPTSTKSDPIKNIKYLHTGCGL